MDDAPPYQLLRLFATPERLLHSDEPKPGARAGGPFSGSALSSTLVKLSSDAAGLAYDDEADDALASDAAELAW